MTTLEIDRLHTNYHSVRPADAAVFDVALTELATGGLELELAGVDLDGRLVPTDVSAAWAICIDRITVQLELVPDRPTRSLAGEWAGAILAAIESVVEGASVADGPVVVYPTEGEALADLVRGAATGDHRRVWAWRQAGLLRAGVIAPGPSDVAEALAGRPRLVPGVLAASAAAAAAILEPAGWMTVARAVEPAIAPVTSAAPAPAAGTPATSERGGDRRHPDVADRLLRDVARAADVELALSLIPTGAWAPAGPPDRRALAVLALAATAPHLARDASSIALVERAASRSQTDPPPARAAAPRAGPPPAADPSERAAHVAATGDQPDADAAGPPAPGDVLHSDWGGVWFLARVLDELDVVEEFGRAAVADVAGALAAVVAAVAGVPIDDPSIVVLSGVDKERTITDEAAAARAVHIVDEWVARLVGRVAERLEAGGGSTELARLWRRTVSIARAPGSIEVTFRLDDVDVDVRRAGLDLDPGFVWWLGAFVGFRYV